MFNTVFLLAIVFKYGISLNFLTCYANLSHHVGVTYFIKETGSWKA